MIEKKRYEAPEMEIYQVQQANIIATSTRASNEEYETGSIQGWY